jgi:hypothetical protein
MTAPRSLAWMSRTIILLWMFWGFVMVVMGLLMILEFPLRFGPMGGEMGRRVFVVLGALLLTFGELLFVDAAHRVFPRAEPRLAVVLEVLPWVLLGVGVIVGAVLWIA